MEHDDDVGVAREGSFVACLLIGPVAEVTFVEIEVLDVALLGYGHGAVRAVVIHEDDVVNERCGDFLERFSERFRRVVRGENHRDAFAVNHFASVVALALGVSLCRRAAGRGVDHIFACREPGCRGGRGFRGWPLKAVRRCGLPAVHRRAGKWPWP